MKPKPCKFCGKNTHTSMGCWDRAKQTLKQESDKTKEKRTNFKWEWIEANGGVAAEWICYLQITRECPILLNIDNLVLEHVKSKAGHPELKYDLNNIKPACQSCNKRKGGLSLDRLAIVFPHLQQYI